MVFKKYKSTAMVVGVFLLGILLGAYLFADVQPRSFLAVHACKEHCLDSNEFLGLLGSLGMKFSVIPFVLKETDKTIVIESPVKKADIHYVIIPKKDIKDIADISESDQEYISDAYLVIGELVREKHLTEYKIYTNGSGFQTVNYLHFHLLSDKPK